MRELTEEIKNEITQLVMEYYVEECEVEPSEVTLQTNPQTDLDTDSLMFVELVELVADKYEIEIKLQSIGKYMLKASYETISDIIDVMCKVYQYGNDIVKL